MGRFVKGQPKIGGKKKGSKNKSTLLFQGILEEHKIELLEKAIQMAKNGNATIMNKLLDKLLPNLNAINLTGGNDTVDGVKFIE